MRWSRSASCCSADAIFRAAIFCVASFFAPIFLVACHDTIAHRGAPVGGETTRLKEDEDGPRETPLFDGKRLRLRGARGETLGLQGFGAEKKCTLSLPPQIVDIHGFHERALEVREPSTEMYGPSRGRGRYPDVLEPSATAHEAAAPCYFDLAIPAGARPGRYRGALKLDERTFPVELTVEPITIDLARDPLVWVFYLPKEIAREHHVADDDSPAELDFERRYVALFRAHGAFLASDLGPARFPPRREFSVGLKNWPVAIDLSDEAHAAADVKKWLAEFSAPGSPTPFAIPVDEPRTPAARARVREVGDWIARAGGGRPHFLRAVTAARTPELDGAADVFISPKMFPSQPGVQSWTYNGRPPEAGSLILDTDGAAPRTWGWIAFRYGVELWYAWEGLYWSDRYNKGGPTDLMNQPITFDERKKGGSDFGNGDGVLAYPGPLPSLRLKALRRGLQDRLLLAKLASCGGGEAAQAIAKKMIPRALGEASGRAAWPVEEAAWEAARFEVLDEILKRCPERAP